MSQPKKQCAGCCLWFDEEVLFVSAKGKRACGRCDYVALCPSRIE